MCGVPCPVLSVWEERRCHSGIAVNNVLQKALGVRHGLLSWRETKSSTLCVGSQSRRVLPLPLSLCRPA